MDGFADRALLTRTLAQPGRHIGQEGTNREPPDFDDYRPAPGQPIDGPGELAP